MRILFVAVSCLCIAVLAAPTASADLIGVSGGVSNLGAVPMIIAAPSDALDDLVTNRGLQGFDEAQGVVTSMAYSIDGGTLAAGSFVDSHMIFLNTAGSTAGLHHSVTFTFGGVILGVMSDSGGFFEAASTAELGAAGTNYTVGTGAAPFAARGLEGNNGTGMAASDGYSWSGSSITVSMYVTEPGDWIRVVTASSVPEPGSLALLALGLAGLGLGVRRRRRATA